MNCSFCEKTDDEVQVMINKCLGSDLYICDECIKLCQKIILDNDRTADRIADRQAVERVAFAELWGTD